MILLPIFAGLIGMTLLEFYVVIKVGQAIGVLPTLGIMVLDAAIGSALMRSQGRAVWRRFRQGLAEGRLPGREVLDGALVVAGGAFLITPGFVTDVFGALLLLPPTRAIARRLVVRHFSGRLLGTVASPWTGAGGSRARAIRFGPAPGPRTGRRPPTTRGPDPRGRATPPAEYDVEGSAVEVDPEERRP
jgi:UPF0716 protein FxsA